MKLARVSLAATTRIQYGGHLPGALLLRKDFFFYLPGKETKQMVQIKTRPDQVFTISTYCDSLKLIKGDRRIYSCNISFILSAR